MTSSPCPVPAALLPAMVAAWLDQYDSPHTRAAYRADLHHYGEWSSAQGMDPFPISEEDLRLYRAACEFAGNKPATVARRLSAVASFAGFADQRSDGASSPHIDRPTLPLSSPTESLGPDEAEALLAAADEMSPRAGLLVRLMMLDGLKVGDVVRADAADVSGRPPRMTLALHPPSHRVVDLNRDTADLVAAYLGRRRQGPLFFSEHRARLTERLTRFGVDYVIKQAVAAAGIAGAISSNTLRRRFIVAAHERGEDLDEIRASAGHVDSRTTRRYLDTQGHDKRASRSPSRP